MLSIDGDWVSDERVVREVFGTRDGRIVGTEWIEHRVWQGRDRGYTWRRTPNDTTVFFLKEEAGRWLDEPRARLDVLRVANIS